MPTYIVIDDKRNLYIHTGALLHTLQDVKTRHRDTIGTVPDVVMPAAPCKTCGKPCLEELPLWMEYSIAKPSQVCAGLQAGTCAPDTKRRPAKVEVRDWKAYRLDLAKRKKLKQKLQ